MPQEVKRYTHAEWLVEAERLFGKDPKGWKFVCPRCATVQSAADLLEAGLTKDEVEGFIGFSCIGRFTDTKGCDWTLGGLFQLHDAVIEMDGGKDRAVFKFAEPEVQDKS